MPKLSIGTQRHVQRSQEKKRMRWVGEFLQVQFLLLDL